MNTSWWACIHLVTTKQGTAIIRFFRQQHPSQWVTLVIVKNIVGSCEKDWFQWPSSSIICWNTVESCDQAEMQTKVVHYFLKYWGILWPGQNANKTGLKWWVNNNNNNNEYLEHLTRTGPKCLRLVKSHKICTSCQPHRVALGWSNPCHEESIHISKLFS